MAVRDPKTYNGAFCGDRTAVECERIDNFLEFVNNGGKVVPELRNLLYEMSNDSVQKIIETKSNKGIEIKNGQLRDYQTLGVMFMILSRNCILSDSVGLGKTAQVAGFLNYLKSQKIKEKSDNIRYVFLTEKTLIHQTREEFIRFTADYVHVTTGEADSVSAIIKDIEEIGDFRGIVGSYSLASNFKFVRWLYNFSKTHNIDYLIIDESDALSNKNLNYKTFSSIRNITDYVIEMNATPFGRNIYSFYNQLDFACPDAMPFKTAFDRLFVNKHHIDNSITGYKDPEGFKNAMRYMVFGQTREELGVNITNSACYYILYEPSDLQRGLLRKTRSYEYVFEYPQWLSKDIDFDEEQIPKAMIVKLLANALKTGEKMMVYCKYVEPMYDLQDMLSSFGMSSIVVNGELSKPSERKQMIKQFQEGVEQVLITNVKRGLNLGFVNHVVFYSFTQDSGVLSQIEGRAVRERGIEDKNIYILACKKHEYERVSKARTHLINAQKHTKEEVSLLFEFLKNGYMDAHEMALEALGDDSELDMVFVRYLIDSKGNSLEVV